MKALGVGLWKFAMRDVEVVRLPSGQPELVLHRRAAEVADTQGVIRWHLTLTHSDSHGPGRGDRGDVIPVVTPAEMGAADARTIAAGTPESELMRRAGRRGGVADACGARRHVRPSGGRALWQGQQRWRRADRGGRARRLGCGCRGPRRRRSATRPRVARSREPTRSIDAMFGTGFRGGLEGAAADLALAANEGDGIVVAVDIPSGVDGATGEVRSTSVVGRSHGHLRRAQARALVPPRAWARGLGDGRRHRHRPRERSGTCRGGRGGRRPRMGPAARRPPLTSGGRACS